MRESNDETAERMRRERRVALLRGAACGTCIHWHHWEAACDASQPRWGHCMAHPPTIRQSDDESAFPEAREDSLCGEFLRDPEKGVPRG